jgi:toxin ParE1/3/4
LRLRLTALADADIVQILQQTRRLFGSLQVRAYAEIIKTGLQIIAADPARASIQDRSEISPGLRSFHLELAGRKRGSAAHLLYFGVVGEAEVVVYRVLHEAMAPKRRLAVALRAERNDN